MLAWVRHLVDLALPLGTEDRLRYCTPMPKARPNPVAMPVVSSWVSRRASRIAAWAIAVIGRAPSWDHALGPSGVGFLCAFAACFNRAQRSKRLSRSLTACSRYRISPRDGLLIALPFDKGTFNMMLGNEPVDDVNDV